MIDIDPVSFVLGFCTSSLIVLAALKLRNRSATGRSARARGQSRIDASDLPTDIRDEARILLSQGRKIEAVKAVRDGTGWGLKRSKEAVEALQREPDRR